MILQWLTFYGAIMFAMSTDNIFWISSSREYGKFKKLPWFKKSNKSLTIEGKKYNTKISYVLGYRIKSVLTDRRDIIPGLITSLILTIIL